MLMPLSMILAATALAACPSGDCGCSWADQSTCVTDPGSDDVCWHTCCCGALGEAEYLKRVGGSSGSGNNGGGGGGGDEVDTSGEWEGVAKTTRYWDCCKVSCAWSGKVDLALDAQPVASCLADGSPAHPDAVNGCGGGGDLTKPGPSFACTDSQPWTEGGVMYGFAAGGAGDADCCTCYELEFQNYSVGASTYQGQLNGERMIVQVTNTGGDLGAAHFDLMIPGGGFGIFNACAGDEVEAPQFGGPTSPWGQRYGGVSSSAQCDNLPQSLRAGCRWRFDDFKNSDNPAVKYRKVRCPESLVAISGCRRAAETSFDPEVPSGTPAPVPESSDDTPAPTPADDEDTPSPIPAPVPETPAPVSGGGGECVAVWGQCAGTEGNEAWTEPCCPGLSCHLQNPWYSQCKPGSAITPRPTTIEIPPSAEPTTTTPPDCQEAKRVQYVWKVGAKLEKAYMVSGSEAVFEFRQTGDSIFQFERKGDWKKCEFGRATMLKISESKREQYTLRVGEPGSSLLLASETGCVSGQKMEIIVQDCPPAIEDCPPMDVGKAVGPKEVKRSGFAFNACDCRQQCEAVGAMAGDFLSKKNRCRCFGPLAKTPKWGKGKTVLFLMA